MENQHNLNSKREATPAFLFYCVCLEANVATERFSLLRLCRDCVVKIVDVVSDN